MAFLWKYFELRLAAGGGEGDAGGWACSGQCSPWPALSNPTSERTPAVHPPLAPARAEPGWTRGSQTLQSPPRTPHPQIHVKAPQGWFLPQKPCPTKKLLCSLNSHEDLGKSTTDSSHERRAGVHEKTNTCFSFTPLLFEDSETSTPGTHPDGSGWGDLSRRAVTPRTRGGLQAALPRLRRGLAQASFRKVKTAISDQQHHPHASTVAATTPRFYWNRLFRSRGLAWRQQ